MTEPAPEPSDRTTSKRPPVDPVAAAAVSIGALGIVFFGILAAIVTAILAAEAGRRAREDRRSQENAYLAMALAVIDGAVWLFLHYRFHLPIWIG